MTVQRIIAEFGPRRGKVRVVVTNARPHLVTVEWRERGRLQRKSWANTPQLTRDAKVWAKAFAEARELPDHAATPEKPTVRELWEQYTTAEFPHLRPKSQINYTERWMDFERFVGRHFEADSVTPAIMDQYRVQRTKLKLSVVQTREYVSTVKRVFRFAMRRELIARNRIADYEYKIAKEDRSAGVKEYRDGDFAALLKALEPVTSRTWRAWVALVIAGEQGARINAILHLKWTDIDAKKATVTWRAEWDKLGRERAQPLTTLTQRALDVARTYSPADAPASEWVLYSPQERRRGHPIQVQAFWQQLRDAEDAAGIKHEARRGAHGLRRMAAGNVQDLTNDPVAAMQWIGDTDLKQARKYLRERDDRSLASAEKLSKRAGVPITGDRE